MDPRFGRLVSPLSIGTGVALATLALRLRDPHVAGTWGGCPTKLLTGLDCPMCGSLRAVNDLTHLDLAAALSSNLVLVLAMPVIVGLWLRRVRACWRGGEAMDDRLVVPTWAWAIGLTAMCTFTVLRNLPGSWLAA